MRSYTENAKPVNQSCYVTTDKQGQEENVIWRSLWGPVHYDDKGGGERFLLEKTVTLFSGSDVKRKKESSESRIFFNEGDFEERINNTHLANDFPLVVTVPGSEYAISNEPEKGILGNSREGTIVSTYRFISLLN